MGYINLIISTIITVLITFIIRKFLEKKRPLLVAYLITTKGKLPYIDSEGQLKPFEIHSHSIIIKNPNKYTINNVIVSHEIYPNALGALNKINAYRVSDVAVIIPISKEYEVQIIQTAAPVHVELFKFAKMLKDESIVITYLYPTAILFAEFNISVRSDEGIAELIPVSIERKPPNFIKDLILILFFIGSVVTVGFLIKLLPIIINAVKQVACT